MYNLNFSSRRNRSLTWTEKASTPSPRVVMISSRNTSAAAHHANSFNDLDPPTSARKPLRSRSNSVDGIGFLNSYDEPPLIVSSRRTGERARDRSTNKSGGFCSSRNIRNFHYSPDLSLHDEMELQQSNASLDVAVEVAASRLGVAVPHANHYCYQVRSNPPPTATNSRNSTSRSRREQRLWKRDVQRQQSIPIGRSSARSEPSSETPTRTYAPSIQCNPVSPMVLQHLPTIVVRYEDLNPDDVVANASSARLDCSMDALSLEDNASTGSMSIGLDALTPYSCTICCEDIAIGTTAVRLPCAHLYHANCIVTWLSKFNTCPMCRFTLPTLADFTTASFVTKHFQSSRNERTTLRPMLYTQKELKELSTERLQQLYKSWVICTYTTGDSTSRPLPIELPATVSTDHNGLMDYLIECHVISLLRSEDAEAPPKSPGNDLRGRSIRDLKALIPPSASGRHIVEKQELIDIILEQLDSPDGRTSSWEVHECEP
jgi:Ring finger domain